MISLLVKLTLVLGTAWLLEKALQNRHAGWRVLTWRVAAVGLTVASISACLPPLLQLEVLPGRELVNAAGDSQPSSELSADPLVLPSQPFSEVSAEIEMHPQQLGLMLDTETTLPASVVTKPLAAGHSTSWPNRFFAIWIVGCALGLLRSGWALVYLRRIVRESTTDRSPATKIATALAKELGVRRCPPVIHSANISSPCLAGIWNTRILLPSHLLTDAPRQLPAILTHELAHLRGRDLQWNSVWLLWSVLLWFHPLAWRARIAHVDACDGVADGIANRNLCDSESYCRTLADLALQLIGPTSSGALGMASKSTVRKRIDWIKQGRNLSIIRRRPWALALLLASLLICAIGGINITRVSASPEILDEDAAVSESTDEPESSDAELLEQAKAKIKTGEFEEAAKLVSEHLKNRPDDNAAYALLAKSALKQVNAEQAKGSLKTATFRQAESITDKAIEKNPDNRELRREVIDFAMQYSRLPTAISHLKTLLDGAGPDEIPLRVLLAQCYAQSKQNDKAIVELSELTGYDKTTKSFHSDSAVAPKNITAYRLLAAVMSGHLKDNEDALAVINQMIKVNPESYEAYITRVQFLDRGGDNDAIERDILKALEVAPNESVVMLAAGDFYMKTKDFDKAEKHYKNCRKNFPDEIGAYRGLSSLALTKRDYETTVVHLNEGLQRDEKNVALLWAKANIELDKRRFEDLQVTRDRLEALNYPKPFLQFLDARIDLANEKWRKASKAFDDVRPEIDKLQPTWLPGLDGAMAHCYEQMGQHDLRLRACERIIKSQPGNLRARWGKIQALLAMGQADEAVKEYTVVEKQLLPTIENRTPKVLRSLLQMELLQYERLPKDQRSLKDAEDLVKEIDERGFLKNPTVARVVETYYQAIGKPGKAATTIRAAKEASPRNVTLFLAELQQIAEKDGIEKAIQILNDKADDFDSQPAIRVTRCELLARVRPEDCRKELRDLEATLDELPAGQQSAAIRGMGRVYIMLKDYAATTRLWKRMAKDQPDDLQLRLSIFELALHDNNHDGMLSAMKAVETIAGKDSAEWEWCEATRIVSRVRNKKDPLSKLASAQTLITEVIAKRDSWDAAYRLQGELYAMQDQLKPAIAALEKSLQFSAGHPAVYRSLSRLNYAAGNMKPAERMLDRFPEELWQQAERRMKLEMLARREALPQKLPHYDENSKDGSEHEWVGKLLANASRFDDAERAFKKAIEVGPNEVSAWDALVVFHLASGAKDKVRALLKKPGVGPAGRNGHMFRGLSYVKLEEWAKAREEFQAVLKLVPNDPDARRVLKEISNKQ